MTLIFCPNCRQMLNFEEEIDNKGTTAEFDTIKIYGKGYVYNDIICDDCDQTFSIKKIKKNKWESFIDND